MPCVSIAPENLVTDMGTQQKTPIANPTNNLLLKCHSSLIWQLLLIHIRWALWLRVLWPPKITYESTIESYESVPTYIRWTIETDWWRRTDQNIKGCQQVGTYLIDYRYKLDLAVRHLKKRYFSLLRLVLLCAIKNISLLFFLFRYLNMLNFVRKGYSHLMYDM